MQQQQPCPKDLSAYLEASYTCLPGEYVSSFCNWNYVTFLFEHQSFPKAVTCKLIEECCSSLILVNLFSTSQICPSSIKLQAVKISHLIAELFSGFISHFYEHFTSPRAVKKTVSSILKMHDGRSVEHYF